MDSREWDKKGFIKHTLSNGEVIRTKKYRRYLIAFDNISTRKIVAERKALAKLLEVPYEDLLADLYITIEVNRHPQRHKRFLKYFKE